MAKFITCKLAYLQLMEWLEHLLFWRRFGAGDVSLERRFVTETFWMETFCRGDILYVRLPSKLWIDTIKTYINWYSKTYYRMNN
jgi:hypothetical protein